MKIVIFGPSRRVGLLSGDQVIDASSACAKYLRERANEAHPIALGDALVPSDLERFIEAGPRAIEGAQQAVDYLLTAAQDRRGVHGEPLILPLGEVELHAPRTLRSRIACAGANFADHAEAMAARLHTAFPGDARAEIRKLGIWGFWKMDRAVNGPDGSVVYPAKARRLDYEGELAVVIGRNCKDIRADEAPAYIFGVTLLADWSIRRLAEAKAPHQFTMGKNFDSSCSLGPCIAVGEVDPGNVTIETRVNGEARQHYNTRDMVFSFGEFMEYLSSDFTLYPGDMISGGTAAGTAADSSPLLPDGTLSPERFLKPGDRVEVSSPAVGSLRARIVAKPVTA